MKDRILESRIAPYVLPLITYLIWMCVAYLTYTSRIGPDIFAWGLGLGSVPGLINWFIPWKHYTRDIDR